VRHLGLQAPADPRRRMGRSNSASVRRGQRGDRDPGVTRGTGGKPYARRPAAISSPIIEREAPQRSRQQRRERTPRSADRQMAPASASRGFPSPVQGGLERGPDSPTLSFRVEKRRGGARRRRSAATSRFGSRTRRRHVRKSRGTAPAAAHAWRKDDAPLRRTYALRATLSRARRSAARQAPRAPQGPQGPPIMVCGSGWTTKKPQPGTNAGDRRNGRRRRATGRRVRPQRRPLPPAAAFEAENADRPGSLKRIVGGRPGEGAHWRAEIEGDQANQRTLRESLFNNPRHGHGHGDRRRARVLDLFAEDRRARIEAMSRGAQFALFIDDGAEARA